MSFLRHRVASARPSAVAIVASLLLLLPACSGTGVAGDNGLDSSGAGGKDDHGSSGKGGNEEVGVTIGVGAGAGAPTCNGPACFTADPEPCDAGLALDDGDAANAAKAIGVCQTVATDGFGLIEAKWVRANGDPAVANAQVGILGSFGSDVAPLEGGKILGLSSGHARVPGQPDACDAESCSNTTGTPPPGFPQDVPNCSGATNINDDIGLELRLKAPSNATGFKYKFRFYSFEFPEYVCTEYNDQYIALVSPAPPGAINGNISFDSATNPVSVNIAFFDVCSSCQPWAEVCQSESGQCPPVPSPCCPAGPSGLVGTGFDAWTSDGAGATTWLETTAPVTAGQEFSIRFAIWDTGDSALDSTAVLDGFEWLGTPGVNTGTDQVPN